MHRPCLIDVQPADACSSGLGDIRICPGSGDPLRANAARRPGPEQDSVAYIYPASTGTYGNISFYQTPGTNDWNVYQNGNLAGTSVDVGGFAGVNQLGAETITNNATVAGNAQNWQWTLGWDNPWTWANHQYYRSDGSALLNGWVSGPSTATSAGSCYADGLAPGHATAAAPRSLTPTALSSLAHRAAAYTGEGKPTGLRYLRTTRKAANALAGSAVNTDVPVYVVQMDGHFTAPSAPKGEKASTGNVMTVVIDAATGQVTDWSLTGDSPARSLAKLATPATLA